MPELGPLLGRFATSAPRGPAAFPLDDLRFRLLDGLYSKAGEARRDLASGQADRARDRISLEAWIALWREASSAAADRLLAEIDRRFATAGEASRMPAAMLTSLQPADADRRAIRARFDAAGIPLERAERPESAPDLTPALLHVSMALDASWDRLGAAALAELSAWERDIARVRAWRRPRTPLWIVTAAALLITLGLGLSLGGYLPAPGPLGVLQGWFWSLPWR